MSDTPLLSIIIVSFQTRDLLEACLRSVRDTVDLSHEVIVVDNASTDGSAEMVERVFPEYHTIRGKDNIGFSPANNLAMEMAKGKYVLLLNPDTVVLKDSLRMWITRHQEMNAMISGPCLLNKDGSVQVSAWKVPDAIDAILELFYLHRIFRRSQYEPSSLIEDREVGFVSGAAMLFERSVFMRIGGLDPELFWMEDTDYCVRVRKVGGTVHRAHGPCIIHIGGQSSSSKVPRMISNQLISRLKFARKHDGMVERWVITMVIYLHVITRIVAFGIIDAIRSDPRAAAYRYAFTKLNRYVFLRDRSI